MAQLANDAGLNFRRFDTDELFLMIDDSFRRCVIRALASGEMRVAADLSDPSGIRRHNKLKHLAALCKAGILVQKKNPNDARAPFYALSPNVIVRKEESSIIVDFGRCRLRLA